MGWTGTILSKGFCKTRKDRIILCDKYFSDGVKVLRSVMVGDTYYAAVKKLNDDEEIIFGAVILTKVNRIDPLNVEFLYKPMTEFEGPLECQCPNRILNLLSPTTEEWALEWRRNCRRYNENLEILRKLPINTRIQLNDTIVLKIAYGRQFRWIDEVNRHKMYHTKDVALREFKVISKVD